MTTQTYIWDGSTWTPSGNPQPGDTVLVQAGTLSVPTGLTMSDVTIHVYPSVTVVYTGGIDSGNSITVDDGSVWDINVGTIVSDGTTLAGSTITGDIATFGTNDTLNLNYGTLVVSGTSVVTDGTTTITPDATLVAGNTIDGGTLTFGDQNTLNVAGAVFVNQGTTYVSNNFTSSTPPTTLVAGSTIENATLNFGSNDVISFTDATLNNDTITLAGGDTLTLVGNAGTDMMIGKGESTGPGAPIYIDGTGVTIDAQGTVVNKGMLWSVANGNTTTLNISQIGGSGGALYYSDDALIEANGTLAVGNGSTAGVGFANAGFMMVYGQTLAASINIKAAMSGHAGMMEILGGTGGATLVDSTNMGGWNSIVFGDGKGTLSIKAGNAIPSGGSQTSLANFKSRVMGFQAGDTIDIGGLNLSASDTITYDYGATDPTYGTTDSVYGDGVMVLRKNGTLIGVLRFAGTDFLAGYGTLANGGSASLGGNLVLSASGSTDVLVTLTSATSGTVTIDGTVAAWNGGTLGDWSNTLLWSGGKGASGLPGAHQTAEFVMGTAEATSIASGSFTPWVATVTGNETAGSLLFADPLGTLEIENSLSLTPPLAGSSGGSVMQTQGTIDIAAGGTLSANYFYQSGDTLIIEAGGTLALSGKAPFAASIGRQGLDVENDATIDGTVQSHGATYVGQYANGQVGATGATVTDTYTMIGGSTYANPQGGTSQLRIDGGTWTDAGGDSSTPYSGAMLIGGGYAGVGNTPGTETVGGTLYNGVYVTNVPTGGAGNLLVSDGATLTDASYAILGVTQNSMGSAMIDGATWIINTGSAPPGTIAIGNSTIWSPGTGSNPSAAAPVLTVGMSGTGNLLIMNGGTVQLGSVESLNSFKMVIGQGSAGASGTVSVDGPTSLLDTGDGPLAIGNRGSGTLSVSDGGTVRVGDGGSGTGMSFGAVLGNRGGNGSLWIGGGSSGTISEFSVQSGNLVIGRGGGGIVTVNNNGSLSVGSGIILLGGAGSSDTNATGPGGTLDVWGGQVQALGLSILQFPGQNSSFSVNNGSVGLSQSLILDAGNATINNSGTVSLAAGGTADIGGGATLEMYGTAALLFSPDAGNRLTIGDGLGSGDVSVQFTGATIDASGGTIGVGQFSGGGTLSIGSFATVAAGQLNVGNAGTLNVNGGTVQAAQLFSSGSVTIGNGGGSSLVHLAASGPLSAILSVGTSTATIGTNGTVSLDSAGSVDVGSGGTLLITDGGVLRFAGPYIGGGYAVAIGDLGGDGSVVVQGSNSRLDATGPISLGQGGNEGSLSVSSYATVTVQSASGQWAAVVGNSSYGELTVDGSSGNGADFEAQGSMMIGQTFSGDLEVLQGGTVHVSSDLDLAGAAGGSGLVTVDGSSVPGGATLAVSGNLVVGYNGATTGSNSVSVQDGGSLSVGGTVSLAGSGTLTVSNALAQLGDLSLAGDNASVSVLNAGTVVVGTIAIAGLTGGQLGVASDGTVSGDGMLTSYFNGIVDDGLIAATQGSNGNQLSIAGNVLGTGILSVGAGATLLVGSVAGSNSITFDGTANELLLSNALAVQASIASFWAGSTIDLQGQTGLSETWDQATNTLTIRQGGSSLEALTILGARSSDPFTLITDTGTGTYLLANDSGPVPPGASTFVWNTGNGGWSAATNWTNITGSTAGPPTGVDTAVFNTGSGSGAGTITGTGTVGTLNFTSGLWTTTGTLGVGGTMAIALDASLSASLTIGGGGTISTGTFQAEPDVIGQASGSTGNLTVNGIGSKLLATGQLVIGSGGLGTVLIENGGTVADSLGSGSGYAAAIGAGAGSAGSSVSVIGANSTWAVTGQLDVGEVTEGSLTVASTGTVTASAVDAGVSAGSAGVISVYGNGSSITDGGQLTIGDAGAGELSITNGATVTAASADLGLQSGGSGIVDIEGSGTRLNVLGNLNVGDFGIGVLTVGEGSTLHITGSQNVGASGVVNVLGGTIDPQDGTISNIVNVGGSGSSPGLLQYTGTVWLQGGTINATTGTADVWIGTFGTDMGNPGLLSVQTGANMVLADGTGGMNGPMVFSGATIDIAMNGKTGTITTLTVEDAAVLNSATITSFKATDTIELPNFYFVGKTIAVAGTVELLNSGGGVIGEVLYDPGFVNGTILEAHIFGAPCFAAGTRIATTRGEVAVESLRTSDQVLLARGGTAPVKWLGTRTVECSRHPQPWDVMPVRVAAHAFGTNQPSTDLMLSPDHAVFVDGVLIPIRYLLNGATVVQETAERITYWHVELEHHDVLLAEGLACESYLDTGNRGAFANADGAVMMHPDFALRVWERESCAPLVYEGVELEAARSWLLERAQRLGFTLTDQPDLHLVVGGRKLHPVAVAGGVHRFVLPGEARSLVIASRAASPSETHDANADTRRLGVMLGGIAFGQDATRCEVALDTLPDDVGFHPLEQDHGRCWRWTDGHARLAVPAGLEAGCDLVLELQVAASALSWIAPEEQTRSRRVA